MSQPNISVNNFHLRIRKNSNLEHSEKSITDSTFEHQGYWLKSEKLISMHETAEQWVMKETNNKHRVGAMQLKSTTAKA